MKILYISHHLKGDDGWSRYARDLIMEISKTGTSVLCLVNEVDEKTPVPQIKCLNRAPLSYVANPIASILNSRSVNKIIKEYNPDIVHILVEPYGTMMPYIIRNKAKFVISVYSTFSYLPILVKGWKRKLAEAIAILSYRRIDIIIPISQYTADHIRHHMSMIGGLNLVKNKIEVVGGWVATSAIEDKSTIDKDKNKNDIKKILFVGAVKPRKGLLESIKALAFVKINYIYNIVGFYDESSAYVKLLRQTISSLGLVDRVRFLGVISDDELKNMYEESDLFLMLSTNNGADFEGYGMVYLEANAHGLPVIGPKDSGVSDAILDGETGYLVDQYNPNSVAQSIENILVNKSINKDKCIDWAQKNTSEIKAKKIFDIYQNVLS